MEERLIYNSSSLRLAELYASESVFANNKSEVGLTRESNLQQLPVQIENLVGKSNMNFVLVTELWVFFLIKQIDLGIISALLKFTLSSLFVRDVER